MVRTAAAAATLLLIATAQRADACAAWPTFVDSYTAVYGQDPKAESLDVYTPDGAKGEALVMFVHGGAWSYGDKSWYTDLGQAFAQCGIAFAIVNYKLAPTARPDAQAAEVAQAVKWLHERAGLDTFAANRMYLMGHSAGAEIVALVAAHGRHMLADAGVAQDTLAGAIALDGTGYDPFAQTQGIGFHPLRLYAFAAAFGNDLAAWQPYDVAQYLTGKEPRVLVVHASSDSIAPEFESADFVKELKKAGDTVTYLQPVERDHFSILRHMTDGPGDPTFDAVVEFVGG